MCKDVPWYKWKETKGTGLYPARTGLLRGDHEASIGDCVVIDSYVAFVLDSRVVTVAGGNKAVVVYLKISGTPDEVNDPWHFTLQNPAGVAEAPFAAVETSIRPLQSSLTNLGRETTGDLAFNYAGPGTYYLIWDPQYYSTTYNKMLSAGRGVWGIQVQ